MTVLLNRLRDSDFLVPSNQGLDSGQPSSAPCEVERCFVTRLTIPYLCDPENILISHVFSDDEAEAASDGMGVVAAQYFNQVGTAS
jgi:hypothetical protein